METDDEDDYFLDPGYAYEDLTFLEACLDNDLDALASILDDNPTEEEINERDRCGRTGMSHLCSCGLLAALELLVDVPELDVNLPDKDGNTPLILAAQAGHTSTVRFLLQDFKGIRIDQTNRLGMTALMKAAIQGRTDCSRLLLYAGADPKLRDQGRKLCAQEWAAYCGRRECADAIAKFSNTKSFYLKSREAERAAGQMLLERSNSLPDLAKDDSNTAPKPQHKRASLRKKIKKILPGNTNDANASSNNTLSVNPSSRSPFAVIARCVSTPVIPGAMKNPGGVSGNPTTPSSTSSSNISNGLSMKRPVSVDNIPRVEVTHPPKDESGADYGCPPGSARTLRSKRRQYSNNCDTIITHINTAPSSTSTYSTSGSGGSGGGGSAETTTTTTTSSNNYNTSCQTNDNSGSVCDNTNNSNNNNSTPTTTSASSKSHSSSPSPSPSSSSSWASPSSTAQQRVSSSSSTTPPSSSSTSLPSSSECKERVSVT